MRDFRNVDRWQVTLGIAMLGVSCGTYAGQIASSIMDNNGEWTIGNSFNQFIGAGSGLEPTAGSEIMHFNSADAAWSGPSNVVFAGQFLSVGIYSVKLDVGSFTNRPLADIDSIGFTAGGALLTPTNSITPLPSAGTWSTWTYEYTVGRQSAYVGTTLGFAIDVATNGKEANIGFDNLRIDFSPSPVPIPPTSWLFAIGLLTLGIVRRHGIDAFRRYCHVAG